MRIREDGLTVKRTVVSAEKAYLRSLRAIFGENYDTADGNPIVDMGKAFGVLGVVAQEDEMEAVYNGMTFPGVKGVRLDELMKVVGGPARKAATNATGQVVITLNTGLSTPTPLFAIGDIVFVDVNENEYELTANVVPNGTTTVTASVRSRGTGADKNIPIDGITGVRWADAAVEAFWGANVADFTNTAAFTGGRGSEVDGPYMARGLAEDASNRSGAPAGIEQALEALAGCTLARVINNRDPYLGGTEDTVLASGPTGSLSELLDSAGGAGVATKIAVKVPITSESLRRFIQHWNARFDNQSGTPTFTVRIEGNNAGSPSGSLLKSRYSLTGWQPADDVVHGGSFAQGDYPCAPDTTTTAWIVFEITAGTSKLRGGTGGTNGDVKVWKDGAWANASINQAAVTVIGGVPVGGMRAVCLGGTASLIAQTLEDYAPVGSEPDGSSKATALRDGVNVDIHYEPAVEVSLEATITVQTNTLFAGNANTIKDILIGYIGGTLSTGGDDEIGLRIGRSFYRDAAKARYFDPNLVTGIVRIQSFTIGLLGGSLSDQDLTPGPGQKFKIALANITVTIVG